MNHGWRDSLFCEHEQSKGMPSSSAPYPMRQEFLSGVISGDFIVDPVRYSHSVDHRYQDPVFAVRTITAFVVSLLVRNLLETPPPRRRIFGAHATTRACMIREWPKEQRRVRTCPHNRVRTCAGALYKSMHMRPSVHVPFHLSPVIHAAPTLRQPGDATSQPGQYAHIDAIIPPTSTCIRIFHHIT